MKITSDLHIHSRYSRACGKDINIENLEKYAKIKGIGLLGTGDFTHPEWMKELKSKLTEDENGILWTQTKFPFILQTEISLMYMQDGKGRRVHFVILAPNLAVAEQITDFLKKKGRVDYDGRPIFGFSAKELVDELVLRISDKIIIIPAHIWTPYFGILGSKSGFDSIKECFGERDKYIHAIETGMSSDPQMNWRLSSLDKYSIVSFSDMHSFWPWRIGREATVFDLKSLTYDNLFEAIKTGGAKDYDKNTANKLASTIETDPGYGKYHFDGHAKCGISLPPKDAIKLNNICPVCKKPLTIGVLHRVEELADRPTHFADDKRAKFLSLVPLSEVIGGKMKKKENSQNVWEIYNKLIAKFGNELEILTKTDENEISKIAGKDISQAILLDRQAKIKILPGFDGEYGHPVFDEADEEKIRMEREKSIAKREKEEKEKNNVKNSKKSSKKATNASKDTSQKGISEFF